MHYASCIIYVIHIVVHMLVERGERHEFLRNRKKNSAFCLYLLLLIFFSRNYVSYHTVVILWLKDALNYLFIISRTTYNSIIIFVLTIINGMFKWNALH